MNAKDKFQNLTPQLKKAAEEVIFGLIKTPQPSKKDLSSLIRKVAKKHKVPCPSQIILLKTYKRLRKESLIEANQNLERLLKKSETRTISGVAPVAILTKPYPCPGNCLYCPTEVDMPKSYNSNEPAVMRAILNNFDAYKQVKMRLKALDLTGHATDKVEIIVIGGTFSFLPKAYQTNFIKKTFFALNETKKRSIKTLEEEQRLNETSKHRCVGLTLETRPDFITEKEVKNMRRLGATRVEIGIQSIYDEVLKTCRRGHLTNATIEATRLLKEAGFKVCYHTMPNLPGSNKKLDLKMYAELFSNPDFQPDQIKIYPCLVTHDADLAKWYKQGKYKPYSDSELVDLIAKIKKKLPPYVRVIRLGRDIPAPNIIAGNKASNIRQIVHNHMSEKGWECRCVRCREVRNKDVDKSKAVLKIHEYEASRGIEYFLSFESKDGKTLFAHLRLRITESFLKKKKHFIDTLNGAAIIREVHTYGEALPISSRSQKASQHFGFGKKLIQEAEKIAQKSGTKKIAVISGVGTREYYRKLGYRLEGGYMVKTLQIAKTKMQKSK